MKKLDKILSMFIIVLMMLCICTTVFAALSTDEIKSDKTLNGSAEETMANVGSTIFTVITNVGIILAVIVIAILGVKYMMGSTEEKAEYKKSMMPYIIGAVLVFGASAIGKIVVGFGKSITG